MLLGHAGGEAVLLARRGDEIFAVGATCTHYGGPLAEGLVVGDTVRCPWHHACFSLRTGEALRRAGAQPGRLLRRRARGRPDRRSASKREPAAAATCRRGVAAVGRHRRRRRGGQRRRRDAARARATAGPITLIGAEATRARRSPEPLEGLPRRQRARGVDPAPPARSSTPSSGSSCVLGARVDGDRRRGSATVDARRRRARSPTTRCCSRPAPSPIRLADPGRRPAARPHAAHARRQPRDHRARRRRAKRAVVLGASFIGLEVAASLRARELEVHVVAPEARAARARARAASSATSCARSTRSTASSSTSARHAGVDRRATRSTLDDGSALAADLVVMGVGVRPRARARRGGRASRVDAASSSTSTCETSAPGVFAAGDIARWPDPRTRRAHPRRALGGRRAPGADRGAQHPRPPRAVRASCRSSGASTTT